MDKILNTLKEKIVIKLSKWRKQLTLWQQTMLVKVKPYLSSGYERLQRWKSLDYKKIYHQHKLLTISAILMLIVLSWNYRKILWQSNGAYKQAPIVKVQACIRKDLPIVITATGKIMSPNTVLIRPQVDGIIKNIGFKEGSKVTIGQLLFELDSSLLQAQVDQMQANTSKIAAELHNNELKLQRSCSLYQDKVISLQEHEQNITNFNIAQANFAAAKAQLQLYKIQLSYSKIYSPTNAIAGEIHVKLGSLASTRDIASLVELNPLDPVQANFTLDENYLNDLVKNKGNLKNLTVTMPEMDKIGKLVFIDNKINDLNGTILLKAEFTNKDYTLWPGQLVKLELMLKTISNALVVPNHAVQTGQQGAYVYTATLINPKNNIAKVKKIAVETDITVEQETIITSNLQPGDLVIIEGNGNLLDQDLVEIYVP